MIDPKLLDKLWTAIRDAAKLNNFDFGIMQGGDYPKTLIDAEGEFVAECADEITAYALARLIDAAYDVAEAHRDLWNPEDGVNT